MAQKGGAVIQDAQRIWEPEPSAEEIGKSERTPEPTERQGRQTKGDISHLAAYFREMSQLEVLKPREEFAIAQKIEALEIEIWCAVLGHPLLTNYLSRRVDASLDAGPSFRSVRRAATLAKKSQSPLAAVDKLRAAIAKIGKELRDSDKDRIVLEETVAHVRALAGEIGEFGLSAADYQNYLSAIGAAEAAARLARNEFVKANLRLVVSVARRFNHGRMSLADLIQEGNLGLMKAVERYDYRKGFRFSTYASWWIRHAISRALADKGREVRLPVHMIDAHHRITRATRELVMKLGRQPTSTEIAEATEMSTAKIEKMRKYLLDGALSLDRPMNDDDGRSLGDLLCDPDSLDDDLIVRLTNEKQTSQVRSLLADLKPIEADILRHRFGLDDEEEQTLKEIGHKYNLSRERIRQLQEQALDKMRRAMTFTGLSTVGDAA